MSLLKHIMFTERMGLEFRAEAYNIFNHTEWSPIAGDSGSGAGNNSSGTNTLNDSLLFRPTGVHSSRILQFALKFTF